MLIPIVSSGFHPRSINGLVLWLDAADTASITQSFGAVSQWGDKSGNGNHATQGTATNQPTTGTRTMNGRNVLDFDGSNDYLALPSGLYGIPAGANTAFIVWRSDNIVSTKRLFSGKVGGNTNWGFIAQGSGAGDSFRFRNCVAGNQLSVSWTENTNSHSAVLRRSGTTLEGYFDSATVSNSNSNGADHTLTEITIGWDVPGTTFQQFDGMVGESLIYNRALTDAGVMQVYTYLKNKWGTP